MSVGGRWSVSLWPGACPSDPSSWKGACGAYFVSPGPSVFQPELVRDGNWVLLIVPPLCAGAAGAQRGRA